MAKKNPPKIGEVRIGRAGNKYNKWDGKRWVPVAAARTAGASGRKASVVSKPMESKPKPTTANTSSPRLEGPKASQKVTRVGSTVKMGASKFVKPEQKTPNRPKRGEPTQIATDKSGKQRWVKCVKPKGKK